jgi:hypothetical protein
VALLAVTPPTISTTPCRPLAVYLVDTELAGGDRLATMVTHDARRGLDRDVVEERAVGPLADERTDLQSMGVRSIVSSGR